MKKTIRSKVGLVATTILLLSPVILLPFANYMTGNYTFSKIYTDESKVVIDMVTKKMIDNEINEIIKYFPDDIENLGVGLKQIEDYLNQNPIEEIELINVKKTKLKSIDSKTINEIYEFQTKHKEKYGFLTIQTTTVNDIVQILNLNIDIIEIDIISMNKFFKNNMGLQRILLIITGFILNLFILLTIYHYFINCKDPKLLRILLLSISIALVNFDWNTMDITYNYFSASLSPFSIFRPGNVGAWQFKLYAPIFSLLYWVKWKHKFINSEKILKKRVKNIETV